MLTSVFLLHMLRTACGIASAFLVALSSLKNKAHTKSPQNSGSVNPTKPTDNKLAFVNC